MPVSDPRLDYARPRHAARGGASGSASTRSESVGRKVRDAELAKTPFMLVVDEREEAERTASVRSHADGDLGAVPAEELATQLR